MKTDLIPKKILEDIFQKDLPEDFFPIICAKDEAEILIVLERDYQKSIFRKYSDGIMWLVIALSHPHLSIDSLEVVGKWLELSEKNLIYLAMTSGNKDFLRPMLDRTEDNLQYLISNFFIFFITSARYNHLPLIQYLLQIAEEKGENKFEYFKILWLHASIHGHLDILEYIEKDSPEFLSTLILNGGYDSFSSAAQCGQLKVLQYHERKAPTEIDAMIRSVISNKFSYVVQKGDLEVIQYFIDKAPDRSALLFPAFTANNIFTCHLILTTMKGSKIPTLQRLIKEYKAPQHQQFRNFLLLEIKKLDIEEIKKAAKILRQFSWLSEDKTSKALSEDIIAKIAAYTASTLPEKEALRIAYIAPI